MFTTGRNGRLTIHFIKPDGEDGRFLTNIFDYDSVPQWSAPIALEWEKWASPLLGIIGLVASLMGVNRRKEITEEHKIRFFKLPRK